MSKERRLSRAKDLEDMGRQALAKIKDQRAKGEPFDVPLDDAVRFFGMAGEEYEQAGDLRKAEANYRLSARAEKTWNKVYAREGDSIRYEPYAKQKMGWRTINRRERKRRDYLESVGRVVSLIGILGGAILLLASSSGSSAQLSPGASSFDWKFWGGIVLVAIGLIGSYFYSRNK